MRPYELLPIRIYEVLIDVKSFFSWVNRRFTDNAPQFVKQRIFEKYSLPNAVWIETGSFIGTSTNYFSKNYPYVYSIEPSETFYNFCKKRFLNSNVELFNATSEVALRGLLKKVKGDLNIWLDGHYSGGHTFKEKNTCPVPIELNMIEENIENFTKLAIFIDDMRCFRFNNGEYADYPSMDYLASWAKNNNLRWHIENDIFVMTKTN